MQLYLKLSASADYFFDTQNRPILKKNSLFFKTKLIGGKNYKKRVNSCVYRRFVQEESQFMRTQTVRTRAESIHVYIDGSYKSRVNSYIDGP